MAMISPLAADLTSAVISIENARPGVFGKSGAYAQVYALFTCAIGGGVLLGPAWVSVAYGRIGWAGTVTGLGVLSATAVLGIVSLTLFSLCSFFFRCKLLSLFFMNVLMS